VSGRSVGAVSRGGRAVSRPGRMATEGKHIFLDVIVFNRFLGFR
jgi:hypothetical protein